MFSYGHWLLGKLTTDDAQICWEPCQNKAKECLRDLKIFKSFIGKTKKKPKISHERAKRMIDNVTKYIGQYKKNFLYLTDDKINFCIKRTFEKRGKLLIYQIVVITRGCKKLRIKN